MTTIAAKITNGKVKMAWDSQVTYRGTATHGMNKVAHINSQFAVGVAGDLRYANLVHRASVAQIHPHDLSQPDFEGYAWLLDELIPAWMEAVKTEKERLPHFGDDDTLPWGDALIGLGGKIYEVGSDFAVTPVGDFGAIGSGSPFAMAAMHLGKSAKQAVEVAAQLDLYTGGTIKEMTV